MTADKGGSEVVYHFDFGNGCITGRTPPKFDAVIKDGKLEIRGTGSVPGTYRLRHA